jgi:hypothetical protein
MINVHYGTVVENNDLELQAGRVKIRIPYLHGDISNDLLPWAKPMTLFSGGSNSYGKSCIPEINSLVWIVFDNEVDMLKPFYIADIHLNNFNPHLLFKNNIASNITGFSSIYPDVKYEYYKNGVCIAVSSNASTPEVTIYHPSGSYIFVNSSGEIQIKAGTVALEKSVLGETLKQTLSDLIDAINAITVNTPVGLSSVPNNTTTFTNIKNNLSTILSAKVKNN